MRDVPLADTTLRVHDVGGGEPLLLLHGFPLDHRMWSGQEALAGRHRLLAPDQRGFGRSGGSAPSSVEQLADDAAAALTALAPGARAVVCGLSLGGYVAQHVAIRHPDLVAALVLVDTKLEADTPDARAARHDLAARVQRAGTRVLAEAMLPRLFAASAVARDTPQRGAAEALVRAMILGTPVATVTAALAALATRPDMTGAFAAGTVPTLLVCGAEDVITPPERMAADAAVIPGARLAVVPRCGHMTPLEDPAAFNTLLAEFVDGLPRRERRA